jgi:hypothetical protein
MRRKLLKSDLARALGLHRSRITQLERQGMPTGSVEAARAWRAEHCDPDRVKPTASSDRITAAPVDVTYGTLKTRLLLAEVLLKEARAENSGSVSLPSARVEKGLQTGLQLLRASVGGHATLLYETVRTTLGDAAAAEISELIERWWARVHDIACDAILLGFQSELPVWGRDFRNRWVATNRGNFPEQPYPGEPRAIEDVPGFGGDDGEAPLQ